MSTQVYLIKYEKAKYHLKFLWWTKQRLAFVHVSFATLPKVFFVVFFRVSFKNMHKTGVDIGSSHIHTERHQKWPSWVNFAQLQTSLFKSPPHHYITPTPRKLCIVSVHPEEEGKKNPLTLLWRSGSCLSELEEVSLDSFHLHLCPAALPLQYYFSLWAEHAIAV